MRYIVLRLVQLRILLALLVGVVFSLKFTGSISIGSLGKGGSEDHVSNIIVDGARLTGTMYGVRIKTWPGGSGDATNIRFQNIQMDKVTNPIIIDQNYCDTTTKVINGECKGPPLQKSSAVKVRNVGYINIKGTVSEEGEALIFKCSRIPNAYNMILLDDIRLEKEEACFCMQQRQTDLQQNRSAEQSLP